MRASASAGVRRNDLAQPEEIANDDQAALRPQ